MPEQPLQIRLEAIDHRPRQFTLTFNSSHYPIMLNPEINVTFSEWLRRLHPVLTGQNDPSRQLSPQELLRNVGTWLWQALLPEGAPTQERDTLAHVLRVGRTPLLLALPDTLTSLPWELLCDPQRSGDEGFLARRRPLMRLSASMTPVTPLKPPLRVLLLISSPPGLGEDSRVDVESERAAVEQATHEMREAGLLHLLVEDIVTPKRVQQALVRFKPHVLHYIGHGGYDEKTGGVLLWEDDQGNAFPLSDTRLAEILRPRNLHAVVLHACETGRSNARTEMRSIADTLVGEGIPAVIAQQANFTYESSQRASEAWYTALTAGQGVAEALFEVRQALSQADRPDWAVPILRGSAACLAPLLDDTALPGSPDPWLGSRGAAADLPAPTGVFVGRHRELRTLCLMLENVPGSGPVLALITGPGGMGKSTLAALAVSRSGGKYKAILTLNCQGYQSVELFLQRMGEFLKRLGAPGFLEQTLPDAKLSTETKIEEVITSLNLAGPVLLVVDNLESVQTEDQTLRDASLLHLLQKLLTNLRGGRVLITGRYAVKNLLPTGKFAAHLLRLDLDDLSPYETSQLLTRHPTLALLGETVRKTLIHEFGGLPYVYDLLSSDAASQSLDLLVHDVQNRITEERKQRSTEEWQAVRSQVVEFAALGATVSRLSEASRTLLGQLGVLRQSFPLATIEQGLGAVRAAWQPLLDWSLLRYDSLERTYRLHSVTRHYAEDLLDEPDHTQAQAQLAAWNERYAERESHDLTDYLEAHRLWRAAGNLRQAGELVIQLAEGLRRFGLYPLLRELCTTTLHDIGESDERLVVQVQGELGIIAQDQGDYPEARQLYGQSLAIFERLDNQSGRASTLHQLGALAYKQGDFEHALTYAVQASILFDSLHSPDREIAQRLIATIRSHMDEAAFTAHWRTIAGDRPLPIILSLSDEETNQQQLLHLVIDFIQAQTWGETKRFLESHLDLLQPEVDAVLQTLAAQQEHDDGRKTIEEHRLLLARCRENGIDAAFAEIQRASSPEATFAAELNRVCNEVVATLRAGNAEQQEILATRLEQGFMDDLPLVGALDFLQVLVAWLRGQDTQTLEEKLQPPFRNVYAQMVAAVDQEETEDTDEDAALTIEKLPSVVSSVILQGTIEERQEFATSLIENQQELPPEKEALGNFFGCLAAVLRGETPEVASLEASFTGLWQAFQDALSVAPDEERS